MRFFYLLGSFSRFVTVCQARNTVFDHKTRPRRESLSTTCSVVFLTKFEVFGNVVKHGLVWYIYSIETKLKKERGNRTFCTYVEVRYM